MSYLLNTNICIYIIKRKPQAVIERLSQVSLNQLFISAVTVAELEYGLRKSSFPDKNQSALNEFLAPFSLLPFDRKATLEYGIIRYELEKKGTQIGSLDTLIAAHAKSLDLILVTNNEREFSRVSGLRIENWVK
jgi:tRNA(fMet)-specific endonuclease VapC